MVRPLSITSPAHPASIAAYSAFVLVGWTFLNTGNSDWFEDSIGRGLASFFMTVMMIGGITAILASLFASKSQDPSTGLTTEIVGLIPLVLGAIAVLSVALPLYGLNITVIMVLALTLGSIARLIQACVERYNLYRASKAARSVTHTSLADPEG